VTLTFKFISLNTQQQFNNVRRAAANTSGPQQSRTGAGSRGRRHVVGEAAPFLAPVAGFLVQNSEGNVEGYYQVAAALTDELADMVGSVVNEELDQSS
jgi:hypothetical protein